MFTIYLKKVDSPKYGESYFNRYYQSWKNAQTEMDKEIAELLKEGAKVVRKIDKMNMEKGFYEYQVDMILETKDGIYKATFALLDGYFQDE